MEGVEKALCGPSRRAGCFHVHRGAKFCRSARHTVWALPTSAIEIELQRPNGARLRVAAPGYSSRCWPWCGPFWRRPDAQLSPQTRILLATEPVDFRKGLMAWRRVSPGAPGTSAQWHGLRLSQSHRDHAQAPAAMTARASGSVRSASHRAGSPGGLRARTPTCRLAARELLILLWNGNPQPATAVEKAGLRRGKVGVVIPRQPGRPGVAKDRRCSCNATRYSSAFTPAWRQVAMRLVSILAM